MNYFEFTEPYYALIKAKDDVDAVGKYIEVVAGNDSEVQALLDESKIVPEYYAAARFAQAKDENGKLVDLEEVIRTFKSDETEILLMDGSLL